MLAFTSASEWKKVMVAASREEWQQVRRENGEYIGDVYLIHFEKPFHHARHYLGWTPATAERRFAKHLRGIGASLTRAVVDAGIGLVLARVWRNKSYRFEKELKACKNTPRLCPICNKNVADELYIPFWQEDR